jgi:hypothetical protein
VKFTKTAEQVLQGATQPIDRPCRDYVHLTASYGTQQLVEPRSLLAALGAANPIVRELGGDDPSVPIGDLTQFAQLVLNRLRSS